MGITTNYITKAELRTLTTRSDFIGVWMVFHVWAVVILAGAVAVIWPNPLSIILAFFIIGSRQHGMAILMHEAAHGLLFNNRRVNDFVGQYVLAAPYGGDLKAYRKYHLKHHKYTQSENDPDIGLSAKFPVSKASLRRKFFRDMTGQTFLRLRLAQMRSDKSGEGALEGITGSDAFVKTSPWPTLLINLAMFLALANWGYARAYFALWLLPLSTWFFAALRLRNIAEHAMTSNDDNPLTHARTVKTNLLERVFLVPYNVSYHIEHHVYMFVPCYNLPKLHKFLLAKGREPEMEIRTGYRAILALATTR